MTRSERNDEIKKLIEQQTRKLAASPKEARKVLSSSRIYTRDGQLTVEYGGTAKKAASAR